VKVRFTSWLSFKEYSAVDDEATRLGTSKNFVVRKAVRQYLGFDDGANNVADDVADVTRNHEE
jgi:hypothetical protein